MERITVFCGSSHGARESYAEAAHELGERIARRGIELVYGGGRVGLMGVIADAALGAGGRVIGVIPEATFEREVIHTGLTKLHTVATMHERKALMAHHADAFIAMPGGVGTFEEFFEVVTWSQIGLHAKPCGLLDVDGYYEPLRQLLDQAVREGFVRPERRANVIEETDPGRLLERIESYSPPTVVS